MDNGNKNAAKVLTTDEIRKLAGDWSLAGDVGLLAHLEQLSESILDRTKETQEHFDELIDAYEDAYAKVGNITNQFLALQNCQFVENRVYDEETPTEEKPQVKVEDEAEQERLLLLHYKEAVEIGVKLLDTHFQEVQLLPNSDSDEEDEISEGNSVIWKPKNPYSEKKFPLLIGSAEWWADDHVGLRTNEDNLETEKIVSESESDFESLKSTDKKLKSSPPSSSSSSSSASASASSMENLKPVTSKPFLESSLEDLFRPDKNDKVDNSSEFFSRENSLPKESVSFLPNLENGPEIDPSPKIESTQEENKKLKKVDNAFTRELINKLSNVRTKSVSEKKEPESEQRKAKSEENLFDETDDASDLFSTKIDSAPVGEKEEYFDVENDDQLFSGTKDLFSGSSLFENETEKPEKQPFTKKIIEPVRETEEPEKSKKKMIVPKKNIVEDLFEDLDDDETLFATKPVEKSIFSSSILQTKKSPPTAAELSWDNDEGLFDSINSIMDDDFLTPHFLDAQLKPKGQNLNEPKSKEPDDIFESESTGNDPFGFAPVEKVEPEGDDLFSSDVKSSSKVDDSFLFGDKPKQPDSISSSRSSLFDDANASKTKLAFVFQKEPTKTEDLFSANENVKPTKKSLFDDDCDDGDDLFGEKSLFENKNKGGELFDASPKTKETKTEELFRDVDDGELFEKSDKNPTPPNSLTLPGKSVGKLSIPDNLKSRFESAAKHILPGGVTPSLKEEGTTAKEEPFEPSNLLKCPNKDRVKIPGRRRPQSRSARQEAIRNSGIWERPRSPPVSSPNPLSPSTDEEDFFKVPELDKNFEKEDQSIFKSDLFESKSEEGLLFDGAPVLSPQTPETKTGSLFDDDDENLFNAPSTKTKVADVKKPLFEADLDEDEDDDDLFRGKVHETPSKSVKVKPKEGNKTKEKGNSSFVDPLGLISGDE